MKKLLWVGDACCDSGFSRATHETIARLLPHYECAVLGINYRGWPHSYPYRVYPARSLGVRGGGDWLGISALSEVTQVERPDVIIVQNDPWHMARYLEALDAYAAGVPRIGIVAIDGKNCAFGRSLNGFDHVVFWTNFAETQARDGEFAKNASVIPLGVDRSVYYPGNPREAREALELPEQLKDAFIFLNVNRNQPRKRFDLSIRYFKKFLDLTNSKDTYLYLHSAPTGEAGVDIEQLGRYYGLQGRVIMSTPSPYCGVSEARMADTYRAANVIVTTTQGEGFGLTTLEAMACRRSVILPLWSALEDLFGGVTYGVPCTSTAVTPGANVLGGIADEDEFVEAMARAYTNTWLREFTEKQCYDRACETRFDWNDIGQRWLDLLHTVV